MQNPIKAASKAARKMPISGKEQVTPPAGLNPLLVYLSAQFSVAVSPPQACLPTPILRVVNPSTPLPLKLIAMPSRIQQRSGMSLDKSGSNVSSGRVRKLTERGQLALSAPVRGQVASRVVSSKTRSATKRSAASEPRPEESSGKQAAPALDLAALSKRSSRPAVHRNVPLEEDEIEDVESEEEQDEADGWGSRVTYDGFPDNLDDGNGNKDQEEDEEPPAAQGQSAASTVSQLPARVTSSRTMYEDELQPLSLVKRKWEQRHGQSMRPPGPTSTVNAIAMGDSATASATAEIDARTVLSMAPSSITGMRRAAPEDTRTGPPSKRAKYKKPSASEYDEVTRRILSLANEIFRVNLLTRGPYELMPREAMALAVDAWTVACEELERPLEESESIMKLDLQIMSKTAHLTNEFKNAARSAIERLHLSPDEAEKKSLPISFEDIDVQQDPFKRSGAYGSHLIAAVIHVCLFRNKEALGVHYPDQFNPVPIQVLALAATALDHAIKEWSTGVHRSLEFTQSSASGVFSGHMKVLSKFEAVNPEGLARLQETLYKQGCYRAGVSVETVEETAVPMLADDDFTR
ncbi:hypothetical protein CALCODRAFT_511058 [Calocera cornea HHB12733]|uniref:DUF6532 domain-containing protein n=1 Tax=Calocera cornea HHB12733 TaxID=1353952 RepID=A0A165E313_9BASI|nr:hypothetical protein CALCODRAFT_511058 [Calocera cornea HHB12733]